MCNIDRLARVSKQLCARFWVRERSRVFPSSKYGCVFLGGTKMARFLLASQPTNKQVTLQKDTPILWMGEIHTNVCANDTGDG